MHRRGLIAGLAFGAAAAVSGRAFAGAPGLAVSGRFQQGGFAFGLTTPRASVAVNDEAVGRASAAGYFVVGFDRDAPPDAAITVSNAAGSSTHSALIKPGNFDIQRINGLSEDLVSPSDPKLLARIKAEGQRKAVGFASDIDADDFTTGFIQPVQGARLAARFGGQRILNGEPKRPHYGADLACPTGTPIRAPAAGVVTFAETGLHFEGGLTMIDHGQGLISLYLHQSRVDVRAGQAVSQGQVIGTVGMEGRATGPHLCWRMRWRGRNLDPTLMVGVRAPTTL
jgi:murein DD-endopeptidase MepM/ murein hydrolase activator NlpD